MKIDALAKKIVKLSKLTLGKDIQLVYTGLRPGEKLIEELLNSEENTQLLDTDLITIKIWSEYKYGSCDNWILAQIEKQKSEKRFYLLCKPDIPWEKDSQRENPNDRIKIYNAYKNLLSTRNYKYTVIDGKLNQRIKSSLNFII